MPHDAHILDAAATREAASENNGSAYPIKTEYLSVVSGTAPKTTSELLRFVDFLARYEARQTVAASR